MGPDLIEEQPKWLNTATVFPEIGEALHERWGLILAHVPETRVRALGDSFDDVYRRALTDGTGEFLAAAFSLTLIQMRWLLHVATISKVVRNHWLTWTSEAIAVWRDRLLDKINQSEPDHFEEIKPREVIFEDLLDGLVEEEDDPDNLRFVPAVAEGAVQHRWRH